MRACLAAIESQDEFDRKDLDRICGQGNKPLGRMLRRNCFIMKLEITGKKIGETYAYLPYAPAVSDLATALKSHDDTINIGLGAE